MSTAASRAGALCGALIGVCSALLTLTAHTAAAGMPPSGAAAVMVALVSALSGALVGTVAAGRRQVQWTHAAAALIAGQGLGHLTLAMDTSGHGAHGLTPSAPMVAAHVAAAVALGALISMVAHLYTVCQSVLSLVVVHRSRPVGQVVNRRRTVPLRSLWVGSGTGLRAPPVAAY